MRQGGEDPVAVVSHVNIHSHVGRQAAAINTEAHNAHQLNAVGSSVNEEWATAVTVARVEATRRPSRTNHARLDRAAGILRRAQRRVANRHVHLPQIAREGETWIGSDRTPTSNCRHAADLRGHTAQPR